MAIDNALPWFPLTPDYIDKYSNDVLKYLRDSLSKENKALGEDRSFSTTATLLLQRADQIRDSYLQLPLLDAQTAGKDGLERDTKIVAAAALYCSRFKSEDTIQHLTILCYLLALQAPELSGALSSVLLRCIKASSVTAVGYSMDDVTTFSTTDFVKKLESTTLEESKDVRWYQNHGTVKVSPEGIFLYPISRMFILMKENSVRSVLSVDEGWIQIMQDKKPGKSYSFEPERFLHDCQDLKADEEKVTLKKYSDNDRLSVRISSIGYDTIHASSIDPEYEAVSGPVRIVEATNVRGLYMTDFARNLSIGDIINVNYCKELGCFSLDESVKDFIYDNFWAEQEDETTYESTVGVLLFPHERDIMNTWLTREGFLVRTKEYDDYDRFTQKTLSIVDYDEDHDFIIAQVEDDAPADQLVDQNTAKSGFIKGFLYKNNTILSPAPVREEVKRIPGELLTELHRIEEIRSEKEIRGTGNRLDALAASTLLSCITGDSKDQEYYTLRKCYLDSLVSFAKREYSAIKPLNIKEIEEEKVRNMVVMNQILEQYGKSEEAEIIDYAIDELPGTAMSAVAKLVQAANRFMGTPSLERLLVDLHREICTILWVTDCIEAEKEEEDKFPFKPEGEDVEHKMSWVIDNGTGKFNETSQSAKCMKTICAFMNRYAEEGEGHLYIGTDEKRHFVSGIQNDIEALIALGELKATGDVEDEYMRKIVMSKIRERFPDTYQNVTPSICCDGKVLDLCVHPATIGVVTLNGTAYYRSGSESKVMSPAIEEEMRNRKYLLRSGIADKIDATRRAINSGHTVCLVGYDSSSSNTPDKDRNVEAFAFTDASKCDSIWAFDPKDRKNKVFHLRRADEVKVLDEGWKFAKQHETYELDIFGFSGDEKIPLDMTLKSTRAKNQFLDQNPSAAVCLQKVADQQWRVKATLFNAYSLEAACSFYLGLSDDLDISASPELKKKVSERIDKMLARM